MAGWGFGAVSYWSALWLVPESGLINQELQMLWENYGHFSDNEELSLYWEFHWALTRYAAPLFELFAIDSVFGRTTKYALQRSMLSECSSIR